MKDTTVCFFYSFLAWWCLIKGAHDTDKKYEVRIRGKTHRVNNKRVKYCQGNHRLRGNKVCELCISIWWCKPIYSALVSTHLVFVGGTQPKPHIPLLRRKIVICRYLFHRMPHSKPSITVPENERKWRCFTPMFSTSVRFDF